MACFANKEIKWFSDGKDFMNHAKRLTEKAEELELYSGEAEDDGKKEKAD